MKHQDRRTKTRRGALVCVVFALLLWVTGCGPGGGGGGEGAPASDSSSATTAQVQVRIVEVMSQTRGATALAAMSAAYPMRTATIRLIITAPDFPERIETIPVETGETSVTVPVGSARTFGIEVQSARGLLIYESTPRTVDLTSAGTVTLDFSLLPVEAVVSITGPTEVPPGRDMTIQIDDSQSPLQGLRLSVPAQALAEAIMVTVDEVYNPANVPLPPVQINAIVQLGPSGTVFQTPILVEFPYDEALLAALNLPEARLRVSRFYPAEQAWKALPNQSVDAVRNVLIVQLEGFSLYTITAGAEPTSPG